MSKTLSFNNQNIEVIQYEEAFSSFSSQKLKNTSLIEFKNEKEYNDFTFSNKNEIVKSEKIDIRNEDILLQNVKSNTSPLNNIAPAPVPYLFSYAQMIIIYFQIISRILI